MRFVLEQVHDGGVALKPGAKPRKAISENGADVSNGNAGLDVRDPDMAAYRREHPEQWLGISNTGRRVLSVEMFGDAFAADEAFGVLAAGNQQIAFCRITSGLKISNPRSSYDC